MRCTIHITYVCKIICKSLYLYCKRVLCVMSRVNNKHWKVALEAARRSSYPSHRASAVRGSSSAFETAPPSWDQRSMDRWSTQLQSPSLSISCWSPALQELPVYSFSACTLSWWKPSLRPLLPIGKSLRSLWWPTQITLSMWLWLWLSVKYSLQDVSGPDHVLRVFQLLEKTAVVNLWIPVESWRPG